MNRYTGKRTRLCLPAPGCPSPGANPSPVGVVNSSSENASFEITLDCSPFQPYSSWSLSGVPGGSVAASIVQVQGGEGLYVVTLAPATNWGSSTSTYLFDIYLSPTCTVTHALVVAITSCRPSPGTGSPAPVNAGTSTAPVNFTLSGTDSSWLSAVWTLSYITGSAAAISGPVTYAGGAYTVTVGSTATPPSWGQGQTNVYLLEADLHGCVATYVLVVTSSCPAAPAPQAPINRVVPPNYTSPVTFIVSGDASWDPVTTTATWGSLVSAFDAIAVTESVSYSATTSQYTITLSPVGGVSWGSSSSDSNSYTLTARVGNCSATFLLVVDVREFDLRTTSIILWPDSNTGNYPANFVPCDGGIVVQVSQPQLYAELLEASATALPYVPDLTDLIVVQDSTSAIRTVTAVNTGNLLVLEPPPHTHGITDPGHVHPANSHDHTFAPHTHYSMSTHTFNDLSNHQHSHLLQGGANAGTDLRSDNYLSGNLSDVPQLTNGTVRNGIGSTGYCDFNDPGFSAVLFIVNAGGIPDIQAADITDTLQPNPSTGPIAVAQPYISLQFIISEMPQDIPVGGIVLWPTTTAPADFLPCDGQTLAAATYPLLVPVLGAVGGNILLPNMAVTTPGCVPMQSSTTAVMGHGGAASVIPQMPAHTHSMGIVSHTHTFPAVHTHVTSSHAHTFDHRHQVTYDHQHQYNSSQAAFGSNTAMEITGFNAAGEVLNINTDQYPPVGDPPLVVDLDPSVPDPTPGQDCTSDSTSTTAAALSTTAVASGISVDAYGPAAGTAISVVQSSITLMYVIRVQ